MNHPETDEPQGMYEGAAWLSSARALKCSLKWGNERNPYYALHVSRETAPAKGKECG